MRVRDEILSKVTSIPPMPSAGVKVLGLLQDPEASILELVKIIEFDQGLTTNILKMANSTYFGSPRKINSLRDAIVRLGTDTVYKLIVASMVSPVENDEIKGYHLAPGELWNHSVAVAIGTEKISENLRMDVPGYTFTSGLLHDIGKIVMGTFLEVNSDPVMSLIRDEDVSFEDAEREVLGISHSEAGAILLNEWNFPGEIVDTVRWHHKPAEYRGDSTAVDLIHVSNAICMMSGIGIGRDGLNHHLCEEAVERLALKIRITEKIAVDIITALEDIQDLFELNISVGRGIS